jgi:hypothetical protein
LHGRLSSVAARAFTPEPDLGQWQSGVYDADDASEASLAAVGSAADRAAAGCGAKTGLVARRP